MLLARRFAPLFLSLSRLSWLMVASLGAISFSLSFNGRVNGSINLPIVNCSTQVLKAVQALEAPGAPAIAIVARPRFDLVALAIDLAVFEVAVHPPVPSGHAI